MEATSARLKSELRKIEGVHLTPIEMMKNAVSLVRKELAELKVLVLEKGFVSDAEEIWFFKEFKPSLRAELIFEIERYNYQVGLPDFEPAAYRQEILCGISRFFKQHEFMYQYYKLGMDELDRHYFLRCSDPMLHGIEVPELDRDFATAGDYLFSKFSGMEKLRDLLLDEMRSPLGDTQVLSKKGKKLVWTGEAANLIEVLYGLFETKQFNGGDVDIADLVEVFEQLFSVNLSNYFQRFAKIKQRKLVSKTRFLDEMVAAVAKRIDDADAFVPSWAK